MCKEDRAEEMAKMGLVFLSLSKLFWLPQKGLEKDLQTLETQVQNTYPAALPFTDQMRAQAEGQTDITLLQVEYSKLFVGPFWVPAPPYGSVYLDTGRQVMGATTAHALNMYEEEGLDLAGTFQDAPDHIAVELEFLYYLSLKANEAIKTDDRKTFTSYLKKRKQFLMAHVGAWIGAFDRMVRKYAETEFYVNAVGATCVSIAEDINTLTAYHSWFEDSSANIEEDTHVII